MLSWLVGGGALALAGLLIVQFNALASLRLRAEGAWSDIDVQLKRRHDLIPTLVETVRGQRDYERGTLEAVVTARSEALGARGPSASGVAESHLAGALRQFFAVAEAYP
ncbi:MAG: LemA family protein, partial [Gemmatimonadales bacterium]